MFEKAVIYATNAHNGQTRKGTNLPFIIHPMEVAAIVAAMTLDQDMLCAAVLHDVVEDCDGISIDDIRREFGDIVASYVYQESEDKSKTWVERKGHTIDFLKNRASATLRSSPLVTSLLTSVHFIGIITSLAKSYGRDSI